MKFKEGHIDPITAARIADVSTNCICQWAITYKIGFKVAGRWQINEAKLLSLLAGESIAETIELDTRLPPGSNDLIS